MPAIVHAHAAARGHDENRSMPEAQFLSSRRLALNLSSRLGANLKVRPRLESGIGSTRAGMAERPLAARRSRGAAGGLGGGGAARAGAPLPRLLRGDVGGRRREYALVETRLRSLRSRLRPSPGPRPLPSRPLAAPTRPEIVGTYRLLRQEVAAKHHGFYTPGEFDLAPLFAASRICAFSSSAAPAS